MVYSVDPGSEDGREWEFWRCGKEARGDALIPYRDFSWHRQPPDEGDTCRGGPDKKIMAGRFISKLRDQADMFEVN